LVDFFDLSAFGLEASVALVSEAESVLLALSDFLEAASVLVFSLVLLVLVFGDVAAFSVGLVFVADSAGLFAVAGAAVAVAAGFVAGVAAGWICGVPIGDAFGVALAEGVMVAAAVAAGVALAAGVEVAAAVAPGVALGRVEALVLEVVVAPVVVPEVEVMPTLKFGTVTP
jgi:hypothetical protein